MTKINLEEVECGDCGHKREVLRYLSYNSWTNQTPKLPSSSDCTDAELLNRGLTREQWINRCKEYEQAHLESLKYAEERRMSDTCLKCGSNNIEFAKISG